MSLTKEDLIDKVEFIGEWKVLQVRNKTVIKDSGVVVSESYNRDSYYPGDELPEGLQPYAEGVWTESLISDYKAQLDEAATGFPPPPEEEEIKK